MRSTEKREKFQTTELNARLGAIVLNLVMFNVLKNPNPLKDVEASALLDVVVLV